MQTRKTRRPEFLSSSGEKLTGVARRMAMDERLEELRNQIDLYTSKQGLEHQNIRFVRELNYRTKVVTNSAGHARHYQIHQYHAIVKIAGKYYLGTVDYGAHRSRKLASQVAFDSAIMAALCGEEVTEEDVTALRFSQEKVTSGS